MKIVAITVVALTALGAGIGGSLAYWGYDPLPERPAKNVSSWPGEVTANGVVEGARPALALRPEVSGTLTRLHFRENKPVARDAVLFELRNATHRQQVALAEAEVRVAKANLDRLRNGERAEKRKALAALAKARRAAYDKANKEYDRLERLRGTPADIQEQRENSFYRKEQARALWEEASAEHALVEAPARADEVAAAEARVKAAEARCQLAREELAKTLVRAPCNGLILQVFAEPGEMVGPGSAQPVLLMADLSKRRVRAFVEELDAPRVRVRQEVVVTADGLPLKEFTGKVGELMPRMGRRTPLTDEPGEYRDRYYREVLIDLDGGDELPVNLRVRVRIRVHPEAP